MSDDPIEDYLDDLDSRLHVEGRRARRILRESEDHLREAAQRHLDAGMSGGDAAAAAIADFGTPAEIAYRFAGEDLRSQPLEVIRPLFAGVLWLIALGLVAIGLSGLAALAMGEAFGQEFVAGDIPGVTYTPDRCAEFMALSPGAKDCTEAALIDHFGEVVGFRVAAGVLGLLTALAAHLLTPLRRIRPAFASLAFAGAFAAFGAAGGGMALIGLQSLLFNSGNGAGASLSAALVALPLAALAGIALLRQGVLAGLRPARS